MQLRLEGNIGYRFVDDKHLVAEIECIRNPREPDNLSGTLSLELWALSEPYIAGAFQGHALGGITLGTLAGGLSWQNTAYELAIVPPPAGTYTLVLMLREWTSNGYVTRDHCNFNQPVTFPLALMANEPGEPTLAPAAPTPQNDDQTVPPQVSESTSDRQHRFDHLKGSALRLWLWIKRHW